MAKAGKRKQSKKTSRSPKGKPSIVIDTERRTITVPAGARQHRPARTADTPVAPGHQSWGFDIYIIREKRVLKTLKAIARMMR